MTRKKRRFKVAVYLVYGNPFAIFIYSAICMVLIGALAGMVRGRPWTGFFATLVLGPIGWFVVLLFNKAGNADEAKGVQSKPTPPHAPPPNLNLGHKKAPAKQPLSDPSVPCPNCGRGIRQSKLVHGSNTCPWCGMAFECD